MNASRLPFGQLDLRSCFTPSLFFQQEEQKLQIQASPPQGKCPHYTLPPRVPCPLWLAMLLRRPCLRPLIALTGCQVPQVPEQSDAARPHHQVTAPPAQEEEAAQHQCAVPGLVQHTHTHTHTHADIHTLTHTLVECMVEWYLFGLGRVTLHHSHVHQTCTSMHFKTLFTQIHYVHPLTACAVVFGAGAAPHQPGSAWVLARYCRAGQETANWLTSLPLDHTF